MATGAKSVARSPREFPDAAAMFKATPLLAPCLLASHLSTALPPWFDNWEALQAAFKRPAVKASIEDERNFIDHSRTAIFVTEEHQIIYQGACTVSLV